MIAIGSRRELLVDDALMERLEGGAALCLHQPVMREVALVCDRPWEGNMCGGYKTYFRDGDRFRLYYQAWHGDIVEDGEQTSLREAPIRIGYLESGDGIHWERPELGLIEFNGSSANNITFIGFGPDAIGVHGFAPFKDSNPDCAPEARYKAVGASDTWPSALYALQSPDGLRWSLMREEKLAMAGDFDSQNLAFWDARRGEYRLYFRQSNAHGRDIRTCTSPDFLHWSEPEWLAYPGAPHEQLYTNMILPYYRAPHLFVGFPARYVERPWSPSIEALPELEHRRLRAKASERYGAAVSDGLFMSSRDGRTFRRWGEAFIRPGLRPTGSWAYGDCYQGWGLLETASDIPGAPNELSCYVSDGYWRGTANAIRRYTLRLDGFVSLTAPLAGGEMVTQPFTFAGERLSLNIATSAGGSAKVELQDAGGIPLPGYALDDCWEIIGDTLDYTVRWKAGA
ncbi:MAG TPA: hypothetical protein PK794_09580, partial [Armatimonadota bacterium]|nr:hypothetical protein [Armatimonadota bacterium]